MINGRKPLSDNVTGRPRIPVPRIDAIATKSIKYSIRISKQKKIFVKYLQNCE